MDPRPPRGHGCASGWTYANLTIDRARVPVVGTLVDMSGLDCSGFSDSIFTHALEDILENATLRSARAPARAQT